MSKNVFRQIRRLTDQELQDVLSYHSGVLNGLALWGTRVKRYRGVWRVWAVLMTLAVGWLAYKEEIIAWFEQVSR